MDAVRFDRAMFYFAHCTSSQSIGWRNQASVSLSEHTLLTWHRCLISMGTSHSHLSDTHLASILGSDSCFFQEPNRFTAAHRKEFDWRFAGE
jgi:hypothetical protein